MKVNVVFETTPEEARRFFGLPDVSRANDMYVDALAKTMQGGTSFEQMQEVLKQVAPMGQFGFKMLQQFIENSAMTIGGSGKRNDPDG